MGLFNSSFVGLDIGSSSVKLMCLQRVSGGRYKLVAFTFGQLPPTAIVEGRIMDFTVVVQRIRELVRKAGVEGAKCCLSVSGSATIIKKLSLPEMTRAELDESIMLEAEQYIPFDINDVNIDVHILNAHAGQGQMDVLMVGAKKDVVNEYVSVATEAGLKPVVVDVSVLAALNMFKAKYEVADKTVVLLDVGASSINIGVLSGGIVAFTRDIGIGGNLLTAEIQKQLDVSYEEVEVYKTNDGPPSEITRKVLKSAETVSDTMVIEIQRSLDFFIATSIKADISHIYLTGGAAQSPAFVRALERQIELPVEVVDPFRSVEVDQQKFDTRLLRKMAPIAGLVVGLALTDEQNPLINLLEGAKKRRVPRKPSKRKMLQKRNIFALLAVFLAVTFFLSTLAMGIAALVTSIKADQCAIQLNQTVKELEEVKSELTGCQDKLIKK